ncbi:MAG: MaoC family dehydratase N-terminal domain-containing protein [Deltaproteobacteria bacterium]|nr:MaoC family dehydratase N-terminal domain-containing protein [Deltaproteobacteria bacterium]
MPLDKSKIGLTSPPETFDIEKGHIRRFAEAIGDTSEIYFDEGAAKAAGYAAIPAPPTFATIFRPKFNMRDALSIDMTKVLHGGQRFEYERPLLAGETITITQKIADIYTKDGKSGGMDFLVVDQEGTDRSGKVVFRARSTTVVRH